MIWSWRLLCPLKHMQTFLVGWVMSSCMLHWQAAHTQAEVSYQLCRAWLSLCLKLKYWFAFVQAVISPYFESCILSCLRANSASTTQHLLSLAETNKLIGINLRDILPACSSSAHILVLGADSCRPLLNILAARHEDRHEHAWIMLCTAARAAQAKTQVMLEWPAYAAAERIAWYAALILDQMVRSAIGTDKDNS